MVRNIKIIGRNAIERCAPSRSQNMSQTNDCKRAKAFFERRTSTGITCDQAFLLPFLYGWRKGKFSSPFPSADLSPFCEKRTPHRRLQPEVSPFPFKYAVTVSVYSLTNIKAICLKTWQNHCPKSKTSSSR